MKKIIFTFIMTFATISLMGQSIVRNPNSRMEYGQQLDSIVSYDLNSGIRRFKHVYDYDQNGNITLVITSEYSVLYGTFGYTEKKTYTYDDNGHCLSCSCFLWEDGWLLVQKIDSVFNLSGECVYKKDCVTYSGDYKKKEYFYENGNCIERIIHSAQTADTLWKPSQRNVWEYDDWNNCLQDIAFLPDGEEWKYSRKTTYNYDESNNLILTQFYIWDNDTQQWVSNERYILYEYNAYNFLLRKYNYKPDQIEETKYTYNDHNQVTLYYNCITCPTFIEQIDTVMYTYDDRDSLIREYGWTFHHTNLFDNIITYIIEFERDEQGRLLVETAYRDISGTGLKNWYKNEFTYDALGRMDYKHTYRSGIDYTLENNSILSYEFNPDGSMQSISGAYYPEFAGTVTINFAPQYHPNNPIDNTLGAKEAWRDFVQSWKTYNSNMNCYGFAYYETNEFPIHNRLESYECNYQDQITGEIVNANVVLYYSDYHVGLPETPVINSPNVFNIEGGLAVESNEPADIEVYDMLGRIVAQKRQATRGEFPLTSGVYVVKVNGAATKAVVR